MKKSEYFTKYAHETEAGQYSLVEGTCLANAADDEPIFVLRANDPIASDIVEIWATLASKDHEYPKVESARKIAHEMRVWLIADLERRLEL